MCGGEGGLDCVCVCGGGDLNVCACAWGGLECVCVGGGT